MADGAPLARIQTHPFTCDRRTGSAVSEKTRDRQIGPAVWENTARVLLAPETAVLAAKPGAAN